MLYSDYNLVVYEEKKTMKKTLLKRENLKFSYTNQIFAIDVNYDAFQKYQKVLQSSADIQRTL